MRTLNRQKLDIVRRGRGNPKTLDQIHNPLGLPQSKRLRRLNQMSIRQVQVLTSANLNALPGMKRK